MYSFFALSGSQGARCAAAAVGSLIVTFVLMAPGMTGNVTGAILPAIPNVATIATGALA